MPAGEEARSKSAPSRCTGASARAPLSALSAPPPPAEAGGAMSRLLARCCGWCGGRPLVADPPVRGDVTPAFPGGEAQPWPAARCPRTSAPACRLRREKRGDPSGTDCDLQPNRVPFCLCTQHSAFVELQRTPLS